MQNNKYQSGFSLLEMIITVVIFTIIITIAIPSYSDYLRKTRRTDATIALLDLANRMERYYAENNNTYTGASITGNLGLSSTTTSQGYYTLSISSLNATNFILQATPISGKSQANDTACAIFTLSQSGQKGISGTGSVAECWGQ